jgi:predicted Zn-ribbon and HTH transcriptional regulator
MTFTPDEHEPEQCRDCGLPFNNAEASKSGRCGECAANASNH